MAIKDTRQILLQTLLDSASTEEEKRQASAAIAKLDATAKPVKPRPTEDTSTSDKYFRDCEVTNRAHLIEEAKHQDAINNLVKAEHMLFDAVSHHLQAADPNGSSVSHQEQLWSTIIEWRSHPVSTPAEPIIGFMKETKTYLISVGISWPLTSLDKYFEEFKEKES